MPENTQAATEGAQAQIEKAPAGFSPITTQEDFDRALKSRLERASRQFREENKDVFEKAKAYDEMVEKNKTDLERANERAAKAEQDLEHYKELEKIASWKQEISKETGVPAEVLRGTTREELMEHAESLKGVISSSANKPFVQSDGFAPRSDVEGKSTRDQFAQTVNEKFGGVQ